MVQWTLIRFVLSTGYKYRSSVSIDKLTRAVRLKISHVTLSTSTVVVSEIGFPKCLRIMLGFWHRGAARTRLHSRVVLKIEVSCR